MSSTNHNAPDAGLRPVRRALLSVSDKSGLVDFARELANRYGVSLVATGGTRTALEAANLPVTDVATLTQFPEILDGRVKTLHPAVFAGLLARRDKPDHMETLAAHNLPEIDLVICNLYPFQRTIARPDVTQAEAIENIDIGGPAMIRAGAKNFDAVGVVVMPTQYKPVLDLLASHGGALTHNERLALAYAAFGEIERYDRAIKEYFSGLLVPKNEYTKVPLFLHFVQKQVLRYGENPHQSAQFHVEPDLGRPCVASAQQLHGKELSYNNILDLDAALNLVREFAEPAAVVVKHNNPCGAATASTLADAFQFAWDGDPQSAFGGILAFNRPVDAATAAAIMDPAAKRFIECAIAPDYDPAALTALQGWKANVRLLKTGPLAGLPRGSDYRRVDGGLLVQTRDVGADDLATAKPVTKRQPTAEEMKALWFAWLVCKHVKSNAIVLARGHAGAGFSMVGVGAGQMSRVDSVEIAVRKAGGRANGSVLASDAFFPFRDNVDAAAAAGVASIIQPGGSVKDADSIAACDGYGMAMVFTGIRHFRH